MFEDLWSNATFTLPPADQRWIEDFVDNYEFGLAFEVLVDSLRENQIAVDSSDYERIESLGSAVKIEPPRWEDLARGSNSQ